MTGESEKPRLIVVERPRRDRRRVLLADRDRETASALSRAANASDRVCLEYASEPRAAGALLKGQQWDVLAVDPVDAADFDFLHSVKRTHRWLATMIVSRTWTPEFTSSAMRCGADGLLFKPVAPAEFLDHALLLATQANERRQREQKRVLAIGAHPDDVEIGCAGTLAKHRAAGDIVHILTLSRGARGGDINVRSLEAQRAAQILGALLKFGNMADGHIGEGIDTIRIIEDAVADLSPTHVYTHSLDDTHQDHRAAHAATVVAARAVPNVYCYQAPSSTASFQPNRYVDITDFLGAKLQATSAYESQVQRVRDLHPDYVIAEARHWGRFAHHVLAEPFRIFRQVDQDAERRLQRADDVPSASLHEPARGGAHSAAAG